MIQRVQSLYLVGMILIIGVLCMGSLFVQFNHLESGANVRYSLNLSSLHISDGEGTKISSTTQWLTLVPAILLSAYILLIIFSFKDRKKQIRLCRWNNLLLLLLLVLAVSNAYSNIPLFDPVNSIKGSLFGILLFVFLFYLNFRALMMIKRDEALVKSADRIR